MKIVFFGSSIFAVPCLRQLVKCGYDIGCVVTQPDKKCGRGLPLCCTSVKDAAIGERLTVFQPDDVNSDASVARLKKEGAELFVVIAYGQILSGAVLGMPSYGAVNVHASYLPRYRGAAPINWAIINGETKTGISVIRMTLKLDAGQIISQEEVRIEEADNAVSLEDRLARLSPPILIRSLESIKNGDCRASTQDEAQVTYAPKLKKSDGRISWNKTAAEVHRLIRGCLGWPGAFTTYKGKILKLYKASITTCADSHLFSQPGQIAGVAKDRIVVGCGKDNLSIEELQLEGGRLLKAKEFLAGHKIKPGERFV